MMRKSLLAAMAVLTLVAGQAGAANNTAVVRVGDRIGARSGTASEFTKVPLPVLLMAAFAVTGAAVVASNEHDRPASA